MWKFLCQSVEGTSHKLSAIPCQDSSAACLHDNALILVCADGAGSAAQAQVGSKLAVETAVAQIKAHLDAGHSVDQISGDDLRVWVSIIHAALETEATARETSSRELACTLLLAVIGPASAAFAQIGDGAIVILDETGYRPVFWPQTGEYLNTTYFITESEFNEHLQLEVIARPVDELAIFSDGLEMLALNYSSRTAHGPFFAPLFQHLRTGDAEALAEPLRQFLDSKPINDRTDDDKTLILATRVANADATV